MASLVGALMQSRVGVCSTPGIRRRWRQVRHAAVRRRVVSLLHGSGAHRSHSHASASVVATIHHRVVLHLLQIAERRLQRCTQNLENFDRHYGGARACKKVATRTHIYACICIIATLKTFIIRAIADSRYVQCMRVMHFYFIAMHFYAIDLHKSLLSYDTHVFLMKDFTASK